MSESRKPVPPKDDLDLGAPYCGACGHRLTGLVDSSKCPECGRPIIDVLTRAGKLGSRYRSRTTLFGLPLLDIAFGATHHESRGSARGIFAIGDTAKGLVAVGGTATGIVAVGGRAFGLFAIGGLAIGLVTAWGGIGIGAIASGGLVLSLLGWGGVCVGVVASGGVAAGIYAFGGAPFGVYLAGQPELGEVYQYLTWFFGPPRMSIWTFVQPTLVVFGVPIVVSALVAVMTAARYFTAGRHAQSH